MRLLHAPSRGGCRDAADLRASGRDGLPCRQKEIAGHIRKGCIFRPAVLFLKQGVGYKKNHKEIKVTEAGLKKMMKLV
jgi:hypothetical protein